MEEKDVHLEPDEDKDVEGHSNVGMNAEPDEYHARQDEGEGDDVEGHMNQGYNAGVNTAPDAVQVGREDDDDDVEGHVNLA